MSDSGVVRTPRRLWALVGLLAVSLLALGACGAPAGASGERGNLRVVVITHGQSSDPFWAVVANGVQDAANDLGVRVEYQAPVSFDMVRMSQMIDAAAASRPSGLIVSVPDADALGGSIRQARAAGIPILSINSGADAWQALGLLAHVGQTEREAGYAAGERLSAAGARRVLCVNHEVGNLAQDERCAGLREAMERAGGTVTVLPVSLADPVDAEQRVARALAADRAIDGVLTLGPGGAVPTLAALRASGRTAEIGFGTFDLEPSLLEAIRDGEVLFALDQQPYLQGYLGVMVLVKYLETGGVPGGGQVVRTGPGFVVRENAGEVIRLVERGIR